MYTYFILFFQGRLLNKGATRLILLSELSRVAASIIIPIVDTLPIALVIYFCGLGTVSNTEFQIGTGALVGTSMLLLTIPWGLSVIIGRVDVDPLSDECAYRRPTDLNPRSSWRKTKWFNRISLSTFLFNQGVQPSKAIAVKCVLLLLTMGGFAIIQVPSLQLLTVGSDLDEEEKREYDSGFATVALVISGMSAMCLLLYRFWQAFRDEHVGAMLESIRVSAVESHRMSLSVVIQEIFKAHQNASQVANQIIEELSSRNLTLPLLDEQERALANDEPIRDLVRAIIRPFFIRFDSNGDGHLSKDELRAFLREVRDCPSERSLRKFFFPAPLKSHVNKPHENKNLSNPLLDLEPKNPPAIYTSSATVVPAQACHPHAAPSVSSSQHIASSGPSSTTTNQLIDFEALVSAYIKFSHARAASALLATGQPDGHPKNHHHHEGICSHGPNISTLPVGMSLYGGNNDPTGMIASKNYSIIGIYSNNPNAVNVANGLPSLNSQNITSASRINSSHPFSHSVHAAGMSNLATWMQQTNRNLKSSPTTLLATNLLAEDGTPIVNTDDEPVEDEDTKSVFSDSDPQLGEDEEADVAPLPGDISHYPANQQRRDVLKDAGWKMFVGFVLVCAAAIPLPHVCMSLSTRTNIPPFYVSCFLLPAASVFSETKRTLAFARRRSKKSISVAIGGLLGACAVNNTLNMTLFLSLFVQRGMLWEFASETAALIVVTILVSFVGLQRTQRVVEGLWITILFPIGLILVYVFENVIGWD